MSFSRLPSLVAALLASCSCSTTPPKSAGSPGREPATAAVSSFELTVLDLERETAFLSALSFEQSAESTVSGTGFEALVGVARASARQRSLSLGEQQLVLTQFLRPQGRLVPVLHANDLGFEHIAIVVRDMSRAYAELVHTAMTPVSPAPQTLPANNPAAAGIEAAYFRDPEGHFMELIHFPAGKGDPAWQKNSGPLFLGIDHSAIACRDTGRSLRFYRDVFGMRVKSRSLNEGREQERLSGVPGARVEITALAGESGPGIELLHYLSPPGGESFPDASAADSVSWRIALAVPDVDRSLADLRAAGFASVPEHGVNMRSSAQVLRSAIVADPDGHRVHLFEPEERPLP